MQTVRVFPQAKFTAAFTLVASILLVFVPSGCGPSIPPPIRNAPLDVPSDRVTLNGVWEFEPQREYKPPTSFSAKIYVPSFWNATATFGYPAEWYDIPAGWFRRTVDIPAAWRGQRVALRFDGIHMTGQVFFNGTHVANQWDPINPLTIDVTRYVKWGQANEIRVGVREEIAESDDLITPVDPAKVGQNFQAGGTRQAKAKALVPYGLMFTRNMGDMRQLGLARDVWLIHTAPVYVQNVFVQTSVRQKQIDVDYEIRNSSDRAAQIELAARVTPWKQDATVLEFAPAAVSLAPGEVRSVRLSKRWADAELWDPDHPFLYALHTSLREPAGAVVQNSLQRFGFREVWRDGRNLYLNGNRLTLRGDTLILAGANALYEDKAFRAMCDLYKRMNINAVRFHGHMGTQTMYDVFDEVGLMAIAESGLHGSCGDQALEDERFWSNAREHLRTMIREERNHPCITIWSIENEIGAFLQASEKISWDRLSDLTRLVKQLDPTRLAWHEGFAYPANTVYDRYAPVDNDAQSLHYPHGEFWPIYYNVPESSYWAKSLLQAPWGFGGLPLMLGEYGMAPVDNGWNVQGRQFNPLQQAPFIGPKQPRYPNGAYRYDWTLHWQSLAYSLRGNRYAGTAGTSPLTLAQHYLEQSGGRHDDIDVRGRKCDWTTPGLKFPNVLHERYPLLDVYSGTRPAYRWLDMIEPVAQAYHPLLSFPRQHNTRFWGGRTIRLDFITFNDLYRPARNVLSVTLVGPGGDVLDKFAAPTDVPLGEHREVPMTLRAPRVEKVTQAKLLVMHGNIDRMYVEAIPVTIYPPVPVPPMHLYDPTGLTAAKLRDAGIEVRQVRSLGELPAGLDHLVIGEDAIALTITSDMVRLRKFLEQGGKVVVLAHSDADFYARFKEHAALENDLSPWPYGPRRGSIPTTVAHLTGAKDLAIDDLKNDDLRFWAKEHAVAIHGLKLKEGPSVTSLVMCNRPVLDDNRSLLARVTVGKGRLYLCQLLLPDNTADEPAARLILAGLLTD